tara:strand:- start:22 stop:348 length:327 start_codon:yes stop_codon:yes gene_type:complete
MIKDQIVFDTTTTRVKYFDGGNATTFAIVAQGYATHTTSVNGGSFHYRREVSSSKDIDKPDAYFGFVVTTGDRAIADLATVVFIQSLTINLPILVNVVAIVVVETERA